ncbi:MAG: ABC transporter ATP-binding protein [Candidatus Thorarchaeota archaeon]
MSQLQPSKFLQARDLVKIYSKGEETVRAVNGITLDIHENSFTVIMGPSGSGKSTFLNMLSGLERPTAGTVLLAGKNITKMTQTQLCEIRRHTVGIVFQFVYMHDGLTAIQNIEYPMMIAGIDKPNSRRRAQKLIRFVGLEEKSGFLPHHLSGGEQQRIGIARALANDPPIIIADEPTGNLDTQTAKNTINILLNLVENENKTVVMVTHDEEVLSPKMHQLVMNDGKIFGKNPAK